MRVFSVQSGQRSGGGVPLGATQSYILRAAPGEHLACSKAPLTLDTAFGIKRAGIVPGDAW